MVPLLERVAASHPQAELVELLLGNSGGGPSAGLIGRVPPLSRRPPSTASMAERDRDGKISVKMLRAQYALCRIGLCLAVHIDLSAARLLGGQIGLVLKQQLLYLALGFGHTELGVGRAQQQEQQQQPHRAQWEY